MEKVLVFVVMFVYSFGRYKVMKFCLYWIIGAKRLVFKIVRVYWYGKNRVLYVSSLCFYGLRLSSDG